MMLLRYDLITINELIDNAQNLLENHWKECGTYGVLESTKVSMEVNREFYTQLESMGMSYVIGQFLGDDLVGYAQVYVSKHPHSQDTICGSCESIYVSPAHRKSGAGNELLQVAQDEAKKRGAEFFQVGSNMKNPIGDWLVRQGYSLTDQTYGREI